MAQQRFIFSTKEIFNSKQGGCLHSFNVDGYYIGPYQRTYKWGSKSMSDSVPVLLTDLYEAFLRGQTDERSDPEYFLQYITVKESEINGNRLFEVIDGQQRLTTLRLIFLVLKNHFGQSAPEFPDNYQMLQYSRYDYDVFESITQMEHEDKSPEDLDNQDEFYMLSAYKRCKEFFKLVEELDPDYLEPFIKFIFESVKLIINKENVSVMPEEVFAQLNMNRVPLTNVYLIKGLLLTRSSRRYRPDHTDRGFTEILDERILMGGIWDEISSWINLHEITRFFFGNPSDKADGMTMLLRLVKPAGKAESNVVRTFRSSLQSGVLSGEYLLFNDYHDGIRSAQDAFTLLEQIRHTYQRMRSWHEEPILYNLLGYRQETENKHFETTAMLLSKANNTQVQTELEGYLKLQLNPSPAIKQLRYDNGKRQIQRVLLALSVFPEAINRNHRFDFFRYASENWTLEHIFPQNPKSGKFIIKDDRNWLLSQIELRNDEDPEEKEALKAQINSGNEIEASKIDWILLSVTDVHQLGNMALLSSKVNSALSNGFFNTKRKILVKRINEGNFVPQHTIDAFSKMLGTSGLEDADGNAADFDDTYETWSDNDANTHRLWIINRVSKLFKPYLNENGTL
ncbi:MAG: hypothetical protein JWP78_2589 [Mucilaginibacter sp.]|nr:hypothetical protein [Mucilaginibacter sp.]